MEISGLRAPADLPSMKESAVTLGIGSGFGQQKPSGRMWKRVQCVDGAGYEVLSHPTRSSVTTVTEVFWWFVTGKTFFLDDFLRQDKKRTGNSEVKEITEIYRLLEFEHMFVV